MDWDLLRVMLEIKRGGSMQAAAETLGIDRATVLRRLNALEVTLGTTVFDRRSDGCELTGAGLQIIGMIEGMDQAAAALRARVGGNDARPAGLVSIALPDFLAQTLIAPVIADFAKACPGITLELRTGHHFANLARGEADIALRNRLPDHNSVLARRLGSVAIGLFATRAYQAAHPVNPADFTGHNLVLFDEVLQGMPGIRDLEQRIGGAHVVLRGSDLPMLMRATLTGIGIGCFPAVLAHDQPDLVPVAALVGLPDVFMLTHRDLRRRARVKAVGDFLARRWMRIAGALSGSTIAAQFPDPERPAVNLASPRPPIPPPAPARSSPE